LEVFLKTTEEAQFLGYFFTEKVLIWTKMGYAFGRFFLKSSGHPGNDDADSDFRVTRSGDFFASGRLFTLHISFNAIFLPFLSNCFDEVIF
jgi:hypothetical protein